MKNKRQELLLRIIKENVVTTQDELQDALEAHGFTVTQSTVSRDIKELRIVKTQDKNGVYRYLVASAHASGGGCSSSISALPVLLIAIAAILPFRKRKSK